VLATMPDNGEVEQEQASFLLALGGLWMQGCDLDINRLHGDRRRRRVPLPTYAFQRKRFWIDPGMVPSRHAVATPPPAPEATQAETSTSDTVLGAVFALIEEILGAPLETRDPDARFMALGLDSLLLTQMARTVRQRMGFEVTFRELAQKYSSPRLLSEAVRAAGGTPLPAAPLAHPGPTVAPPAFRPSTPSVGPADIPAVTDVEASLFALIEEILGAPLETRDVDARFMALGLDSLLLTQMARAVRQRLGFEVTFRDLAQKYSSVRLLCAAVAEERAPVPHASSPSADEASAARTEEAGGAAQGLPGARLGRDARGRPAWFIPDPSRPGRFIQLPNHD